jgi:hypothetical protein
MALRNLLVALSGFLVVFGILEFYYRIKLGFDLNAVRRNHRTDLLAGHGVDNDCNIFETIYPHPQFAYISIKNKNCQNIEVTEEPSRTLERLPRDHFTILLVGEELAARLGSKIEEELNRSYLSPNYRPFKITTDAIMGRKQPIQSFILYQRAKYFHAFLSIEGRNELDTIFDGRKLESPPDFFYFITKSRDYDGTEHKKILRLKRRIEKNFITSRSAIALNWYLEKKRQFETRYQKEVKTSFLYLSFEYPANWPASDKIKTSFNKYIKYIETLDALAGLWNSRAAIFFQPDKRFSLELESGDSLFKVLSSKRFDTISANFLNSLESSETERVKEITGQLAKIWDLRKK